MCDGAATVQGVEVGHGLISASNAATDLVTRLAVYRREVARSGAPEDLSLALQRCMGEAEVRVAIANGVVKINLDTDGQYAFTRAIADHLFSHYDGVLRVDGGVGRKSAFDPRAWGRKAQDALAGRVVQAAELFGAAGRSLRS